MYDLTSEAKDEKSDDNSGNKKNEKELSSSKGDYLIPFLQHVIDINNITKEEALKARDQCIKSFQVFISF